MIKEINNLFTEQELSLIYQLVDSSNLSEDEINKQIDSNLGRLHFGVIAPSIFTAEMLRKINSIGKAFGNDLSCTGIDSVEYNNKYGTPNLPVHYDHDFTDLIIIYQIKSNISWGIGVDMNVYNLKDNCAVAFNPNKSMHWRPPKIFKDGDFVKVIFIRFRSQKNQNDYSNLDYSIDHPIFKEVEEFRQSLKEV